ncbi:hypothetical protein [Nostoc sp.]
MNECRSKPPHEKCALTLRFGCEWSDRFREWNQGAVNLDEVS